MDNSNDLCFINEKVFSLSKIEKWDISCLGILDEWVKRLRLK